MKINIEKLQLLDIKYANNELVASSISTMIKEVLRYDNTKYENAPENIKLALRTLKYLGVIEEEPVLMGKPAQLNS